VPTVVIVGNPNVGKTTVFNRLTGHNARVGNYPGITVERRVGRVALDGGGERALIDLVDVPGTYSLSARSPEEQIALGAALGLGEHAEPALVLVVVDAGQLLRNLYLAAQLVELEVPIVVALNMMDEVGEAPPDPEALGRVLGVPCVGCVARTGDGFEALQRAIEGALASPDRGSSVICA
jgi:ferrous iron transport protein B